MLAGSALELTDLTEIRFAFLSGYKACCGDEGFAAARAWEKWMESPE